MLPVRKAKKMMPINYIQINDMIWRLKAYLYEDRIDIFEGVPSRIVTVAYSGDSLNNPVETEYIDLFNVLVVEIVDIEPASLGVTESNSEPPTCH